ncbi:acetyl-CoA carboxylase biotin carboxyl carrier protein subunit [Acidisphaera sp. L21]|uniref:acetyl-CoA carboxylase biotin carboxyl carrier protein n=1 Tax=Acidisphaera sp. L21 TaxID=1641851 RepID=UPI001C2033A1|nr:acetyl-CoA carboxylase biotin carboxyl carrier protein subunit [Acidisphaera sp. L21]
MASDSPAEQVRYLASLLAGTSIGLLELTTAEGSFRLLRDGLSSAISPMVAPMVAPKGTPGGDDVCAPTVGVFRHAHPLQQAPLAPPGQQVQAGDPLGLMQIGSLLLAVQAPRDGVVDSVLAADGAMVGFGTPVVRLR